MNKMCWLDFPMPNGMAIAYQLKFPNPQLLAEMISKENHQQKEEKDLMRKEKAGAVTEEKVAQEEVAQKDRSKINLRLVQEGKGVRAFPLQ